MDLGSVSQRARRQDGFAATLVELERVCRSGRVGGPLTMTSCAGLFGVGMRMRGRLTSRETRRRIDELGGVVR